MERVLWTLALASRAVQALPFFFFVLVVTALGFCLSFMSGSDNLNIMLLPLKLLKGIAPSCSHVSVPSHGWHQLLLSAASHRPSVSPLLFPRMTKEGLKYFVN